MNYRLRDLYAVWDNNIKLFLNIIMLGKKPSPEFGVGKKIRFQPVILIAMSPGSVPHLFRLYGGNPGLTELNGKTDFSVSRLSPYESDPVLS